MSYFLPLVVRLSLAIFVLAFLMCYLLHCLEFLISLFYHFKMSFQLWLVVSLYVQLVYSSKYSCYCDYYFFLNDTTLFYNLFHCTTLEFSIVYNIYFIRKFCLCIEVSDTFSIKRYVVCQSFI